MVNRFFLLFSSAIILFSCTKSKIKVEGTIDDPSYENKQAYLYVITSDSAYTPELISSVVVSNNQIKIDGFDDLLVGETPAMGILSVGSTLDQLSEDDLATALVIEDGVIKVAFNKKNGTIGGTPRNEDLNKEHVARAELYELVMSVDNYKELSGLALNEKGEDGNIQLRNLDKAVRDMRYDFTKANMGNNVGQYLFWKSYTEDMFTPNQLLTLINLGPDEFKSQEGVEGILEILQSKYVDEPNTESSTSEQ